MGTRQLGSQCTYIHTPLAFLFVLAVPTPASVRVTVSSNPVTAGSSVRVTCTVELSQQVSQSDLSLLMVDAQLSRDGTTLALTGPTVAGTTFTYTIQLDSFGRNDSGNYTCTATVRPQPTSTYLIRSVALPDTINIKAGMHHPQLPCYRLSH